MDIGGATTDVFSVFRNQEGEAIFNRTVSANLGMSYSISNVLAEAGMENVLRWVPFDIDVSDLGNRIKNKMIRPTTIPQALEELIMRAPLRVKRCGWRSISTSSWQLNCVECSNNAPSPKRSPNPRPGRPLWICSRWDLIVGSGGRTFSCATPQPSDVDDD